MANTYAHHLERIRMAAGVTLIVGVLMFFERALLR
jgi:hypothetical protein